VRINDLDWNPVKHRKKVEKGSESNNPRHEKQNPPSILVVFIFHDFPPHGIFKLKEINGYRHDTLAWVGFYYIIFVTGQSVFTPNHA
jgi:hypothetical protein